MEENFQSPWAKKEFTFPTFVAGVSGQQNKLSLLTTLEIKNELGLGIPC